MKQFKRIQDKNGQFRYYVNGKRVTTKKGASQYVKQNFSSLNKANLSAQEARSFTAKANAEKGAEAAKIRTSQAYRFKGKFLDKAISRFLQQLSPTQKNMSKRYPDVKDYGQLLKELQKDLQKNLNLFELQDASQFGLPNEKRARTEIESTAELIDVLKTDYPNYKLIVITTDGETITNYKQGLAYIAQWERNQISLQNAETENLAYLKITYRPAIDIVNKTLTIDLEDPDRTSIDALGS
jgi:hypothetical protein